MNFDYNTLKRAARDGVRLGNWKGKAVFAASYNDLESKGSGVYYVLYDDDNLIVDRKYDRFYSCGQLEADGAVDSFAEKLYLDLREPAERSVDTKPATSFASGNDEIDVPDIRLNNMVENTLKTAREITIDDLLKGFDYGLA